MNAMWDVVLTEFSDIGDAAQFAQLLVRMTVAAVLGGAIGLEREWRGKAAGIRTHMLVAMGCALFILVPLQLQMSDDATSRVVQGLLAGIGFLCAGAILKPTGDDHIYGLTTAAGLWMTAAIGLAAGMGREVTAITSTLLALVVLELEGPLRKLRERDHKEPA